MALYAIGDLHLSLGTNKPMDVFGPKWANYVEHIQENFSRLHDLAAQVVFSRKG